MKPRHQRFAWIAAGVAVLGVAVALVLNAFQSNLVFFFSPSQTSSKRRRRSGRTFRIGGLVEERSVKREADGLIVRFVVTDTAKTIPVVYEGILPDLFKEGKGVVAQGKLGADGVFAASEVLAKHDENYMPPEAAEAVKQAHVDATEKRAAQTLVQVTAQRGRHDPRTRPFRADPRAAARPRAGHAAAGRRARGASGVDGAGAARGAGQFLFVAVAFGCLALVVRRQRLLGAERRDQLELRSCRCTTASPPRWGAHEGSMLLWVLMLSVWASRSPLFSRHLPDEMVARVLGVMGLVGVGFLLFMLFTSNPFERLFPAAADGRDLNPLLQDPGMVIHPPMLYMGYVGFSVAFAFAIAALLGGRLDATWARWSRPWTTLAWMFLTLGIALGSWWAYYELGWGGWWFWDPVENASFMPWLVGTALIHSLAVTEKRGAFKSWTVLLAIVAFSLSLLGTFLVRSGVLTSVHAFATDPRARRLHPGVPGGRDRRLAAAVRAGARRSVGLGGRFALVSRESLLLAEQRAARAWRCGTVLLGTLYPLVLDALEPRQDLGRPAVLRRRVRAADGAAACS